MNNLLVDFLAACGSQPDFKIFTMGYEIAKISRLTGHYDGSSWDLGE